jgi:hypothetical protein
MLEIYMGALEEGLRADVRNGVKGLWKRYPFLDHHGQEVWLPLSECTYQQREELSTAIKAIGTRYLTDANELQQFAQSS